MENTANCCKMLQNTGKRHKTPQNAANDCLIAVPPKKNPENTRKRQKTPENARKHCKTPQNAAKRRKTP
jgi:hypothetical protein